MNIRLVSVLCLFLTLSSLTIAQNVIPDSLVKKSYDELKDEFFNNRQDSIKAQIYVDAYFNKATDQKDTFKLAKAYYYKTLLEKDFDKLLPLYDKAIEFSINIKNENLPAIVFLYKGVSYYQNRNFKKALDNYLMASKYNHGKGKEVYDFQIKQGLALLKTRINKDQEALNLIKDCMKYIKKNNLDKTNPEVYFTTTFSLANAYRKLKLIDSASVYTQFGMSESNRAKMGPTKSHFLLLNGILELDQKKYLNAKKDLEQSLIIMKGLNDRGNQAVNHYFLAKTNIELNDISNAIKHFEKVDSIFQITKDLLPEITGGYNFLIDYYKSNENLEKQLEYTQKLISVDSTLTSNYKYLNDELINGFDIPNLIHNKEEIIYKLKKKQRLSNNSILSLLSILLLILLVLVYQLKKNHTYRKRFENLMADRKSSSNSNIPNNTNKIKIQGVSEEIVLHVLNNLALFEQKRGFTNSGINLNNLADSMDTNSNYLSKIINHNKNKSFSNYLKDLRISYAFERLKSEKTFRKYTVKAIASECGFGSSESFSKTFFKVYGIYPSYYIKKLEKEYN